MSSLSAKGLSDVYARLFTLKTVYPVFSSLAPVIAKFKNTVLVPSLYNVICPLVGLSALSNVSSRVLMFVPPRSSLNTCSFVAVFCVPPSNSE